MYLKFKFQGRSGVANLIHSRLGGSCMKIDIIRMLTAELSALTSHDKPLYRFVQIIQLRCNRQWCLVFTVKISFHIHEEPLSTQKCSVLILFIFFIPDSLNNLAF